MGYVQLWRGWGGGVYALSSSAFLLTPPWCIRGVGNEVLRPRTSLQTGMQRFVTLVAFHIFVLNAMVHKDRDVCCCGSEKDFATTKRL